MPVRSKRLWGPVTVSVAGTLVYTSPAGETTLVKALALYNPNGLAQLATFYLGAVAPANALGTFSVPGTSGIFPIGLFLVLQPGESLHVTTSTLPINVAGFGAQLEGAAD